MDTGEYCIKCRARTLVDTDDDKEVVNITVYRVRVATVEEALQWCEAHERGKYEKLGWLLLGVELEEIQAS